MRAWGVPKRSVMVRFVTQPLRGRQTFERFRSKANLTPDPKIKFWSPTSIRECNDLC